MSFLSILLVASAFYFAHARPDSQSWYEAIGSAQENDEGVEHAAAVPAESSVPVTDPKDYQHQLFGFIKDVEKAVDQHMTPLMSKLDVKKQDQLKSMGIKGMASYANYWVLLIADIENKKLKGGDQFHEDSLPRDEMILQFESYYPLHPHIPYTADTQDEDEEYGE